MREQDCRLEALIGRWIVSEGLYPDWTAGEVAEVALAIARRIPEAQAAADGWVAARRAFRVWHRPLPRTAPQKLAFHNAFFPVARRVVVAPRSLMDPEILAQEVFGQAWRDLQSLAAQGRVDGYTRGSLERRIEWRARQRLRATASRDEAPMSRRRSRGATPR